MAQTTKGIRAVLSNASIYSLFQRVMGAHGVRLRFVEDFVRPRDGMAVLDIGCGPADILAYLPAVDYHGFDISPVYIERARGRFGDRGTFHLGELSQAALPGLPKFDVVLALGVLHHLDDNVAVEVLRLAASALAPGGRVLTIDPCLEPGQNPIARFLVKRDRGQNVRTRPEYTAVASAVFPEPRVEVRHKSWIPYTHCVMECAQSHT